MQNIENMLNMHNIQDTYMHVTNQGTQIMLKGISTICEYAKYAQYVEYAKYSYVEYAEYAIIWR
jgi:hypothetical protein